jgi:tRNA(Arg) A34 adenosine deaminase TadA
MYFRCGGGRPVDSVGRGEIVRPHDRRTRTPHGRPGLSYPSPAKNPEPSLTHPVIHFEYPSWVNVVVDWERPYATDEDRMSLAIAIARENVDRETGGPFGAAIVESLSGRIVAVGMNSVVRMHNCTLHGEMVAFMMAQRRVRSFTLAAVSLPMHELVTSCEPCAMCLGATLWSGVKRVVCGATRDDARRLQFEEGPVFPESWRYVEARGIAVVRNVLREEARAVMELYRAKRGAIYNA